MNTISTEKIENIFTKDITILSYVFMAVSFGYLLLCNWEMKKYNILGSIDGSDWYWNYDIINEYQTGLRKMPMLRASGRSP